MRYASSIRYGGQLINAEDADYNSYKHLGLICPECKNPVFLRARHIRTAHKSGESIKVGQSFAHFKAKDPAQVLMCENRVAVYSRQDLEKKASAAKNQRLKLLHRWFWDIYYRCFELERRIIGINNSRNRLPEIAHQICTTPEMDGAIRAFQTFNSESMFKVIDSTIQNLIAEPDVVLRSVFVKERVKFLSAIDRDMHVMVCSEVAQFLQAGRQLPLLEQVVSISKIISEQSPTLQQQIAVGKEQLPVAVMRHAIISLCFIDWAGEFEQLSK